MKRILPRSFSFLLLRINAHLLLQDTDIIASHPQELQPVSSFQTVGRYGGVNERPYITLPLRSSFDSRVVYPVTFLADSGCQTPSSLLLFFRRSGWARTTHMRYSRGESLSFFLVLCSYLFSECRLWTGLQRLPRSSQEAIPRTRR